MKIKKQKYILSVILILICLLLYSAYAEAEPTLLWKMKFDSRIIKTSRLEDTDVSKGRGARFPLRTVMTEKSIFVLDSKGKVEKRILLKEYDKATMSDDGKTMAGMKGREITISDLDEEIHGIIKIADPQPVVLPEYVSFELSPNGEYIIIMSKITNTIYFHDNDGDLLVKHQIEDLRGAEIKFSEDSHYAVIHIPNWGEGITSGYILFFDKKGKKLWRFDHKGCQASFDISSDASSMVIAAEDKFYYLNKKGKIIYKKDLVLGIIDIALSDDGKYTALAKTLDHSVSLLNNRNGNVLWSYSVTGFDPINSPFTSLDVSGHGNRIAVAISKDWTRRNEASYLYIFDKLGNTIWQKTLQQDMILIALSHQSKSIFIGGFVEAYFYGF